MATSPTGLRRFGSNPSTPTKSRVQNQPEQSPSMAGGFDGSSTSTFSSPATTGRRSSQPEASQSRFQHALGSGSVLSTSAEVERKLYVRADPALLTCFDPVDKELYDLWAPKR